MLKVKFVDFSDDTFQNITMKILEKNFGEVSICDSPDFLFYSVSGYEHMKYDAVKIFYTGENVIPDFNICDYAIAFSYLEFEDRYKRIPLYNFYLEDYKRALNKHIDVSYNERKFCNFVYSNGTKDTQKRTDFFELLSKYKKVDSGGRYLNNVGGPVKDKYLFQKEYKFSIAFENASTNGYTTEKIIQAFGAGTIPIYWGSPRIAEEFNPKSFINCHDYKSFDDVVERVKEIDQNDELFYEMLNQPIYTDNALKQNSLEEFEKFIVYICGQDPLKALRRNNVLWGRIYQEEMANASKYLILLKKIRDNSFLKFMNSFLRTVWGKIKNVIRRV